MPSRSRMRSAHSADVSPLSRLTRLSHLNLIGFGVADVSPLGALGPCLVSLEVGLNPLSADSLRVIGRLGSLRRLELGGERVGVLTRQVHGQATHAGRG